MIIIIALIGLQRSNIFSSILIAFKHQEQHMKQTCCCQALRNKRNTHSSRFDWNMLCSVQMYTEYIFFFKFKPAVTAHSRGGRDDVIGSEIWKDTTHTELTFLEFKKKKKKHTLKKSIGVC